MRYGILARPRACAAALAVSGGALLALAGGASAETYKASSTEQFVEAVSKANANPGANTIVLASGGYLPKATVTFANTTGLQTVEGPASGSPAKLEGADIEPVGSELFVIKASVSVTFKNVVESTSGSGGVPAIDDAGTMSIEGSTVGGNNGPGIHVEPGATATIRNSTVSDGLDFGLLDNGTTSFFNSTVAFNKNGGIENHGTLNLTNTIVAKNTGSGDCVGAASTSDHSLDSDGSCGVGALSKKDPLLGKLVNNGGPTPTHALLTGSPAISAGDTATCTSVDQRGFPRPDIASTACDVGAFELYEPGHYYENGVLSGSEPTAVVSWGTLTFRTTAGAEVTCHTGGAGTIANPAGGVAGVGSTQVFTTFDCESPACAAAGEATKVTAESLPWSSHVEVEGTSLGTVARTKVENVKLKDQCMKGGVEVSGETYTGSDRPRFRHGTSALHPGFVEFDANASTLIVEATPKVTASIEGEIKSMGYNEQELFNVKSP
jgi:hypothetical protein